MSNEINIKLWGVRGSLPCANSYNMEYGGNTTCLQITLPHTDELLIVDCGTGVRNLGNDLSQTLQQLNGRIFITHPHWDHIQGYPFFKPFLESGHHFSIYMLPYGNLECKDILQDHLSKTFFPITVDKFSADIEYNTMRQHTYNFEHYSVELMPARHTIPTAIFKFRINDKTIVFAPDNELPVLRSGIDEAFVQEFRNFVAGADILIHDGQYSNNQYYSHIGWGHSDWLTVLETTKDLGIKRLFLTHHSPDNDDTVLAAWDKEIHDGHAGYFEQLMLAKEGMEITV